MKRSLLACLSLVALAPLLWADNKSDWETLKKNDAPLPSRIQAARLIAERAKKEDKECGKVTPEFIDLALKANTPPPLASALSDAVMACDSEETAKVVAKHIGQGQPAERTWILRTARGIASPEVDKAILAKGLTDEDIGNRQDAVNVLVQHKCAAAVPAFEAILKAAKDQELMGAIVTGISTLLAGAPQWNDWEVRLIEFAKSKNEEMRRAALAALAKSKDPKHFELFVAALPNPDWSTRALAVAYLEAQKSKAGIAAIIEQMKREVPGTRMNVECYKALERLSGMNFGEKAEDWATWWKNTEATFEFPKPVDPDKVVKREKGYESGTSVAQFYGIVIDSKRVCFVIDISGSMVEKSGDPESVGLTRMDVAKRELDKIVDQLPPGTLFNIVPFSSDVEAWLDHIGDLPKGVGSKNKPPVKKGPSTGDAKDTNKEAEKDEKQKLKEAEEQKKIDEALRAKAHEYVKRLAADGGTNIHDALERAFDDPEVDTIFFLTDGDPTYGREIAPTAIREAVQRWNVTRKIQINCISIGNDFDLLKWIAADSGGEYRQIR